jgi:hypothetical protein
VIPSAKRSPSSPIPMSPEDVNKYSGSVESFESVYQSKTDVTATTKSRDASNQSRSTVKARSESRTSDKHRHRSSSRNAESKSKTSSRTTSRRRSPAPTLDAGSRGRPDARREGSRLRSPSSPVPMAASGEDLRKTADTDPALRFVSHDREKRSRSRKTERGSSARREASPDRHKPRTRSSSRRPKDASIASSRKDSFSRAELTDKNTNTDASNDQTPEPRWTAVSGQALAMADDALYAALYEETSTRVKEPSQAERRKKEIAAAELEARRLSLARRPSAPAIPLPGHLTTLHGKSLSVGTPPSLARATTESSVPTVHANSFIGRMIAKHSPTEPTHSDSGSSGKGSSKGSKALPGTPRAMRHPEYSSNAEAAPDIPDNLVTLTGSVYRPDAQPDAPRSMSAPIPDHSEAKPAVPADLPMHPAYDWRLPNSRSSSKSRDRDFSPSGRAGSRDRAHGSPRDASAGTFIATAMVTAPPLLPELQHLASPPPPPPPPSGPHAPAANGASLVASGPYQSNSASSAGALTQTGVPDPPAAPHHRRGRSGNENFVDKIRSLTTRLRSTSRGRNTQSPPSAQSENASPYESVPMQAFQPMHAAT